MAKQRRKVIQAGSLWMAVQYSAIHTQNQHARREARAQISTPARESLNAKTSWQKLMLLLAANFRPDDLHVSVTYRPKDRPMNREEADKRFSLFIRWLRAERRACGQELKYVRVTEGYHSGGELHHHMIINSTGNDFDVIRKLWSRWGDNIDFEQFGIDGPERWAKYLTKEPRIKGRRHVGDRTWRASRNLIRPHPQSEWVSESDELTSPPGAYILDSAECKNMYGHFRYLMARLPD